MDNKEERYLNVTLKNEQDDKDEVVISFSGIFKKLKKYFLIWIVAAVVAFTLIFAGNLAFSESAKPPITALVGFTFKGIEQGLDPDGNTFDVNTIKSPTVIEAALTELGHSLEELEQVRSNITIQGITPSDAIDRITVYKSAYSDGSLAAAQEILDTTYYPTQFKVTFKYANTPFSNEDAVLIFNTMLDCYRDYFFETYGYNEALGSAVTAISYEDYDYAEAIDVFDSSLATLGSYVGQLAKDDTTRFRSASTGYTFADLSEAIKTLRAMDLDILSSYITVNNVTKDKDALIDYYNYRIDALNRQKTVAQEQLNSITESIETYEKDVIMVFGNGTDNTDTQYSQASEQYDNLIEQKVEVQTTLSTAKQQIEFYNKRITALKGKSAASDEKIAKVEADLASLNIKINELITDVNKTSNEYYETVSFANAYNVLVPATTSDITTSIKNIINDSLMTILIVEMLLVVAYIGVAFVTAIVAENKKNVALAEGSEKKNNEKKDDSDKKSK